MSCAVMISHSTKEKPIADAICHHLETAGLACWIAPRNIPPGAEWTASILEGIATSRLMVLVFSESANESKHVSREVLYAGDNQIPVLPFRVQEAVPTGGLAYYLLGVQWLDAWQPPLEAHLDVLVSRVRLLLADRAAAARQEVEPATTGKTRLSIDAEIEFECAHCGQPLAVAASDARPSVNCPTCSQPVTIPRAAKQETPAPPPLAPAVLDALANRLGLVLGPIARHLVKNNAARVTSLPKLYQALAESIPDKKERAAFLKSCVPGLDSAPSPLVPTAVERANSPVVLSPEALTTLKNGLAVYLGPMAGLVVEQTARQARTIEELHELLAAKIASPKDREKWRKSLPRS